MIIDFRTGLRTFIRADASILAIVGQGVFWNRIPQGFRGACIVVQRVSSESVGAHMEGPSGIAQVRLQFDAWDSDDDRSNNLADLIKNRIEGYRGLMGSVRVQGVFFYGDNPAEDYDELTKQYRTSRDYNFIYEER